MRMCRSSASGWGVPFVGAVVFRSSELAGGSFPATPEAGNSSRDVGLFRGAPKGVK